MRSCRRCGLDNAATANFCSRCGAALPGAQGVESRKVVTVVFADVVNSTALADRVDAESVRRVMDQFHETARQVFQAYGGVVGRLAGDGLMTVFGVPTLHDDDALRAVRATDELLRDLAGVRRAGARGPGRPRGAGGRQLRRGPGA